ncbi:nuclear transport factor 2 family protein [Rhodococcus sp. 27YEA15]|uniref:nuclear transport factor 2 family protein n=1 Tax=Rhodococcus sp. 27YEA15 TaxID=3156259 RepID=UPI003C7AC915
MKKITWIAVPAVAAILLAGCSSNDDPASTSNSSTASPTVAPTPSSGQDQLAANKKVVTDFYELAFNERQFQQAADQFIGDTYIQHNPGVADGAAAFVEVVGGALSAAPDTHVEVVRVFAQDDLVGLQTRSTGAPDSPDGATFDIFRLRNGKIVEHWDTTQAVPATSANPNTMFDGPTTSEPRSADVLDRNSTNAVEFLQLAFNEGKAAEAADRYIGDTYTQHNPSFGDGKEAFVQALSGLQPAAGDKAAKFPRTIAEGDFVLLQTFSSSGDGTAGSGSMDIFRFDQNGKIVEHWDAVQDFPATTASGNTVWDNGR